MYERGKYLFPFRFYCTKEHGIGNTLRMNVCGSMCHVQAAFSSTLRTKVPVTAMHTEVTSNCIRNALENQFNLKVRYLFRIVNAWQSSQHRAGSIRRKRKVGQFY